MKSKKITDLNNDESKWFFREDKNYVNFDIPSYFSFSNLLTVASALILEKGLSGVCKKCKNTTKLDCPKNYENVNYTILSNKDGAFAWRPLQIIHPILYIDLVNVITEKYNWKSIVNRFNDFSNSYVECISVPRVSQTKDSHKATQVVHWWEEMEQQSIKMALKYDYVFSTDVINCYGSIYTHSIEWALAEGGKNSVKENFKNKTQNKSIGAIIDEKIRGMNYGQTNGIPQGSSLMDFIAEIVLGYGDIILTEKIKSITKEKNFHIFRYRDDYRIFVNDLSTGHQILKCISDALYELGMKMNPGKTLENGDIILSSMKFEKLERILIAPINQHYQKEALRIYQLSKKYPNSGLIVKELNIYYNRIHDLKYLKNTDIDVLLSIFTMIALNSPKLINWTATIVSKLLSMIEDKSKREEIILLIYAKFKKISNTGLIDVWLQRISLPLGIDIDYENILSKVAIGKYKNSKLWESSWLNDTIIDIINSVEISGLKNILEKEALSPVISREEVELFRTSYN